MAWLQRNVETEMTNKLLRKEIESLRQQLTSAKDMAALYHDQLTECQRERDEYRVKSDNYCALLMDANQELASTKLDAERYRFLKRNENDDFSIDQWIDSRWLPVNELDQAIDAARKEPTC